MLKADLRVLLRPILIIKDKFLTLRKLFKLIILKVLGLYPFFLKKRKTYKFIFQYSPLCFRHASYIFYLIVQYFFTSIPKIYLQNVSQLLQLFQLCLHYHKTLFMMLIFKGSQDTYSFNIFEILFFYMLNYV